MWQMLGREITNGAYNPDPDKIYTETTERMTILTKRVYLCMN